MEGKHVGREQRRLLTDTPDRCTEPTMAAADGRDEGIAIGDRRVGHADGRLGAAIGGVGQQAALFTADMLAFHRSWSARI